MAPGTESQASWRVWGAAGIKFPVKLLGAGKSQVASTSQNTCSGGEFSQLKTINRMQAARRGKVFFMINEEGLLKI